MKRLLLWGFAVAILSGAVVCWSPWWQYHYTETAVIRVNRVTSSVKVLPYFQPRTNLTDEEVGIKH